MSQECVMINLDNTENTRNGDVGISRWETIIEAINYYCEAKIQQNPENTIGIATMSSPSVDVILTPLNEIANLIASIQTLKIRIDK